MNKPLLSVLALCSVLAACGSGDDNAGQSAAQTETAVGSDGSANNGGTSGNSGSDTGTSGDNSNSDMSPPPGMSNDDTTDMSPPDMADGGSADTPTDPVADNNGQDSTPAEISARYELTFINLTAGQPLSPPAVLAHRNAYKLFTLGKPSTVGLEMLSEGAATAGLLEAANATGIVWTSAASDQGPIGPGGQSTMTVDLPIDADPAAAYLSAASMLVNTNDAITAVRGLALHGMDVGDSQVIDLNSYDTGTEANDEVAAHIPGPAGGGAGFSADRDDIIDAVLPHPGAISADDGLATSALRDVNRWNDPVGRLRIRRVQ
jgi:hypothetical protein